MCPRKTTTKKAPTKSKKDKKPKLLLSSDTLSGYGLDLVFQMAKDLGFDGIDLAMWKNFDAWQQSYVQTLIEKYDMPVPVVQTSRKVNLKEMNEAVDLAREVDAAVLSLNAPEFFNLSSGRFLKNHLPAYKHHNKEMKFSIINPEKVNYLGIIPKYYFQDMVSIIKKHKTYLALDIAHMSEDVLESQFLRKMGSFIPYLSVVYLSDVDKHGKKHLPLGEGVLKLPVIMKKFKGLEYDGYFSLKLDLSQKVLADMDKVELILKKCRIHFKENYENVVID